MRGIPKNKAEASGVFVLLAMACITASAFGVNWKLGLLALAGDFIMLGFCCTLAVKADKK